MKLTIQKMSVAPSMAAPGLTQSQQVFAQKLAALRAATGRAERFISRCACAVHDRPFAVVYERIDPQGPFAITGIYRDDEGNADGRASGETRRREVAAGEIDSTGWRCPHCATEGLNIACGGCSLTICGGRTKTYHGMGPVFNCRASCGSRGPIEDARSVKGVEPTRRGAAYRAGSSPQRAPLPAPADDVLRLGVPGRPRLK